MAALAFSTPVVAENEVQVGVVDATVVEGPLPVPTPGEAEGVGSWQSGLPANWESYVPMPLPEPTPPRVTVPDGGSLITYDIQTGEEILHERGTLPDFLPESAWTDGWAGIAAELGVDEEDLLQQLKNFGPLNQVMNPEDYPWRVNCKVFITFAGGNYVGSGVLISPLHVLTAGHVVHDIVHGGTWATAITVVPAYENGAAPYETASAVQLHSWTGWTVDANWEWDMGIIDLGRPIGLFTGWHGYGYTTDDTYYTGNTFHNPGYPAAAPYNGQYMYYWYGPFDAAATHLLTVNSTAYGGQSGSGAYYWDGGTGRWVHAELSSGAAGWHQHCRITSSKFTGIQGIIDDDEPSTFDLWALDTQVAPTTVTAGDQLSDMTYVVYNHSTAAWSGTVPVTVYLSTNDNITTSDTPIQSHTFTYSFGAMSAVTINVTTPPTIPVSTPTGDYYIGVIMDIADANVGNNDSSWDDTAPIHIDECPVPDDPSNCQASDGTYCAYVQVTWTDNSTDEDGFEIVRGTTSVGTVGANVTTFYDQNAVPCISYSYRVRAYNDCGNSGYSNTNTGIRKGFPDDPTDCLASDGTYCDKVRVSWTDNSSGVCAEDDFRIYRNGVWIGTAAANATYWDDTGATPCVTYTYDVRAYNNCGYSGYSNENTGYRKAVPAPPSNCQASYGAYCDRVQITWNDNSSGECAETGFDVYRNGTLLGFTSPNGTQFNDTTAEPCVTYTYHVVAENACGESSESNSDTGARKGIPEAPSDCQASDGTFCDRVRITWSDNSGGPCPENGFEVVRNGTVVGLAPIGATQFDDMTADPCETYSYAVRAQNNCGDSEDSDPDPGTRLGVPLPPTNCAATDTDPTKIRVTWNDNASGVCSETGYIISREGTPIGTTGPNVEYFDDMDVPECDVGYNYQVAAENACGESSACQDDGMMPCAADCEVTPTMLTFNVGTIGGHEDKTFKITNNGTAQLTGTVTESCGEFQVTPGSYNLAPGAFETFTVRYEPTDCGNDACTIETSTPCADVECKATGPGTPVCAVDPTTLSFSCSPAGCTDSETFTITNTGCGTLSGTVTESCSEFTVTPGGYSLGPGEFETFTVEFTCEQGGSGSCTIDTGTGCDNVVCNWTCDDEPCPDCPNHFTWASNTGCTYSIVISDATWEGGPLPDCSEIAVFDGELCVGAVCWMGEQAGLTAWCDDTQTTPVDGYVCGNEMLFQVYNYDTGEICTGVPAYTQGDGTFCHGAFAMASIDASCCQDIPVATGWNCVSSYMDPTDPDMAVVWADVIAAGHLNIVKNDCTGEFCIPGVICNMLWDSYSCYMAHLSAPDVLSVCGAAIPEEGPVAMEMGWNCLPYFPRASMAPDVALAGCWSDLNIVKSNCTGQFCIPGVYCGITQMNPGECYMAHMAAPCDLYYPAGPGPQSTMTRVEVLQPRHFASMTHTGDTYNIVVRDPEGTLARGDEVAVFSGELCVGAGVWTDDGVLGLTVWGDDVTTEALDGCAQGDALVFRVWDSGEAAEYEAIASFTMGDGTYGTDAYGLVDLGRSSTEVEAGVESSLVDELAQNFPNPFNPETVISYRLSAPTHVRLRIFNVHGEQVRVLVEQVEGAGEHSVGWDGRDDSGMEMSAGIYFYRLETEQIQTMKKMVLVK
jgi:V8-like Glu-specific endopeptidase